MTYSYKRGNLIIHLNGVWVYADDHTSISIERPCTRCGKMPTPEGYDACMGHICGATAVCCGHGVREPYTMYDELEG